MSSFTSAEETQGYPCNTCKALFSSVDKVKSHYKGDWHIFNSKRRAHGLVPLSKADFKAIEHTVKMPSARAKKSSEKVGGSVTGKKLIVKGDSLPDGDKVSETGKEAEIIPLTWGGITANTAEEMIEIAKAELLINKIARFIGRYSNMVGEVIQGGAMIGIEPVVFHRHYNSIDFGILQRFI